MALERRFGSIDGPIKKDLRIVYQFDGDPEPEQGPDESLLIVRVVNTRAERSEDESKDECTLRFDFESGEDQTNHTNKKTNDEADNSHQNEREKG